MPPARLSLLAGTLCFAVVAGEAPVSGASPATAKAVDKKGEQFAAAVLAIEKAAPDQAPAKPSRARKVLVYGRASTHGSDLLCDSVRYCFKAMEVLGRKTGAFEAVCSGDPAVFLPESLRQFDAVVMNNTHEPRPMLPEAALNWPFYKALGKAEQAAADEHEAACKKSLLEFVRNGKGLVGIHAAACMVDWVEYMEMLGGRFTDALPRESLGGIQVGLAAEDAKHPLCAMVPESGLVLKDQIYLFGPPGFSREKVRVLLNVDPKMSADPKKSPSGPFIAGKDYPVSWIRAYGQGRVFYCSLGHENAVYANPQVLRHYLAGIQFAIGDLQADVLPSGKVASVAGKDSAPASDRAQVAPVLQGAAAHETASARKSADRRPSAKVRVMLLNHHHPNVAAGFPATKATWTNALDAIGGFTVTDAEVLSAETLQNIDVVLVYNSGIKRFMPGELKVLEEFVNNGGGLAGLHATDFLGGEDTMARLMGGRFTGHGFGGFMLRIQDRKHPVTAGLEDFAVAWDETYRNVYHPQLNMRVGLLGRAVVGVWMSIFASASVCQGGQQSTGAARAVDADPVEALEKLVPLLASDDPAQRTKADNALFDLCLQGGRPGAGNDLQRLSEAMAGKLSREKAIPARLSLLRHLERVGRAECVEAVASLLDHEDAAVRGHACRALGANPSAQAGTALRQAVTSAGDASRQIERINSLGVRKDAADVEVLAKLLASPKAEVATAAAKALGKIGGSQAAEALSRAVKGATGTRRLAILHASIECADDLCRQDRRDEAVRIFRSIYVPEHPYAIRLAALRGLAVAAGEKALPDFLDVFRTDDVRMQVDACKLIAQVPGEAATKALAAVLEKRNPAVQVAMLAAFGDRGDATAKVALTRMTDSEVPSVRVAACLGLAKTGDDSALLPLARFAAGETDGHQRSLLRDALAGLSVSDQRFLAASGGADGKARVEIIMALEKRSARAAAAELLKIARGDGGPAVRLQALTALAALGSPADIPALMEIVGKSESSSEREAAEKAVGLICRRIDEPEKRAAAAMEPWKDASPALRVSLVRILGWIGDDKSVAEVQRLLKSDEPEIREAAARALVDGADSRSGQTLLDMARSSADPTLRILALRSYVTKIAPQRRDPGARLGMYQEAWKLANRPEEKLLIVSGLAGTPRMGAAELVAAQLDDKAIRAECEIAIVQIAAGVLERQPPDIQKLRPILTKLIETTTDQGIREKAKGLLSRIGSETGTQPSKGDKR